MGILSDILEFNRENSKIDPCMFIPASRNAESAWWNNYCEYNHFLTNKNDDEKIKNKKSKNLKIEKYEKEYLSYRYLIDNCLYREKQLLALQNEYHFATETVNNAIQEYLLIVRNNLEYAQERLANAKKQLKQIPNYHFSMKEKDIQIPVESLLYAIFDYLSYTATFDDSHLLQEIFEDTAKLICRIEPEMTGQKPKIICKKYYEATFHPSYGIKRCENCGQPIFEECPYCFNCFERN